MTSSGPLLEVEGLTVSYNGAGSRSSAAVLDAGMTVPRGGVVGVVGESGCGKSTFALAAIGYRDPSARILSGRSCFMGDDLLRADARGLRSIWGRHIAYVPQGVATSLSPAMPVGRQMEQPLRHHRGLRGSALRERCVTLLERVGVPDPAGSLKKYPHQFSGGQQQRIALAIALACEPELLVLDEPTTGLDVTTQAMVVELLTSIQQELGTAIIFVSHDIGRLATIAHELYVMYAGEVVEHGATTEVLTAPRHPYTRSLLDALPNAHELGGVKGIPGGPPATAVPDACAFADRCFHVGPRCRDEHPALEAAAPHHEVRCLRWTELRREAGSSVAPFELPVPEAAPLLSVDHLSLTYPGAPEPAIKEASLHVAGRETLGIVGESGSGKSTLLRAIAGLLQSDEGSMTFRGAPLEPDVRRRDRRLCKEIQLIFQDPATSLNPRQSVGDVIGRSVALFRPDVPENRREPEIQEMLAAVKLPARVLHRYPRELSGGQRQRVAVARAFAARPSLLLCDEITSALDVSVQATILELIVDLAKDFDTAVIFVSHDLAVVRTICRRTMVMRHGEVRESGATERLFQSPADPYTKALLGAIPPPVTRGSLAVERP
jgi:peptide/nickel transport system ATP-binding protein